MFIFRSFDIFSHEFLRWVHGWKSLTHTQHSKEIGGTRSTERKVKSGLKFNIIANKIAVNSPVVIVGQEQNLVHSEQ